MRGVFVLGSTGSIGTQCLEVISQRRELFSVCGLSAAGSDLPTLARQAVEFDVPALAVSSASAEDLRGAIVEAERDAGVMPRPREIFSGSAANEELLAGAAEGDVVLNGINGAIGLGATLAALRSGATLALANKESLVAGSDLVKAQMRRPGQIVPVDSEHSAMYQCLLAGRHQRGLCSAVVDGDSEVSKLILTASGGPFRKCTRAQLEAVTLEQALEHPTWKMGPVVTINSATLMNKALELIEAHHLFAVPPEDIIAVVHPQSHVHSGVRFHDGSTILQASPPSMLIPIALGLSASKRLESVAAANEFTEPFTWDFEPVNDQLFPAVGMAREVCRRGGGTAAVFNAANEVAVEAFRRRQIRFVDILDVVFAVCQQHQPTAIRSRQDLFEVENYARQLAEKLVAVRSS